MITKNMYRRFGGLKVLRYVKYIVMPSFFIFYLTQNSYAGFAGLQIIADLNYIKMVLSQIGPVLSGVLFVIAGVFYALGQIMPPDKRAIFHTTAINIIIGGVVLGVLSVASTSLAVASSHLLANMTSNSVT
jgi:hypothetical protein